VRARCALGRVADRESAKGRTSAASFEIQCPAAPGRLGEHLPPRGHLVQHGGVEDDEGRVAGAFAASAGRSSARSPRTSAADRTRPPAAARSRRGGGRARPDERVQPRASPGSVTSSGLRSSPPRHTTRAGWRRVSPVAAHSSSGSPDRRGARRSVGVPVRVEAQPGGRADVSSASGCGSAASTAAGVRIALARWSGWPDPQLRLDRRQFAASTRGRRPDLDRPARNRTTRTAVGLLLVRGTVPRSASSSESRDTHAPAARRRARRRASRSAKMEYLSLIVMRRLCRRPQTARRNEHRSGAPVYRVRQRTATCETGRFPTSAGARACIARSSSRSSGRRRIW